jgi:hypothetical protein
LDADAVVSDEKSNGAEYDRRCDHARNAALSLAAFARSKMNVFRANVDL